MGLKYGNWVDLVENFYVYIFVTLILVRDKSLLMAGILRVKNRVNGIFTLEKGVTLHFN